MSTNTHAPRTVATLMLAHMAHRVRAEYDEMPGLSLTPTQAQRLWGLDADDCEEVLASLTESGYLRATVGGYVRA